jgi:hypothetical protein
MAKPILLGLALASVAPIVISAVGAGLYGLRTPELIVYSEFLAIVVATPASAIGTPVIGYGAYRLCRRLGAKTASAYGRAGLSASIPLVGVAVFIEWDQDYESLDTALMFHILQIGLLISGPAAALTFWSVVRPDIIVDDGVRSITRRRIVGGLLAAATAGILGVFFLLGARAPQIGIVGGSPAPGRFDKPKLESRAFDPVRSTTLIADLNAFALSQGAHLHYFTMPGPTQPEPTLIVATIAFPDGAFLEVSTSEKGQLLTRVVANGTVSEERLAALGAALNGTLDRAIERANALPVTASPVIPSEGEGGKFDRPWWDWRFHI